MKKILVVLVVVAALTACSTPTEPHKQGRTSHGGAASDSVYRIPQRLFLRLN